MGSSLGCNEFLRFVAFCHASDAASELLLYLALTTSISSFVKLPLSLSRKPSNKPNSLLFQPTILGDVKQNMMVFKNENFGPIVPIMIFQNDDEVIKMANNTEYGLAAYFFTTNPKRIWSLIDDLEYGMFGINSGKISSYLNPFGGLKESGIGREGSFQTLEPFLETKFINWNF